MRIAKVIGKVTLNRAHPSFRGATLRLVLPLALRDVVEQREPASEPLVAWDELGTGEGDLIALSEGPEAAQPFRPEVKPVDAYATALLDHLNIDTAVARTMLKLDGGEK
jgi:microcompartment protein CcmK/EutM